MGLTKFVLKRPVTTVLCILCLVVFGFSSVMSAHLELTPEMNMPMMAIMTVYPGASPDDIDELVSQPIENEVAVLNGIKTTTSMSNENVSFVMLEYEYGTDMDKAYSDLKKKTDVVVTNLPEDVQAPVIMEINMNDQPTITMAVNNESVNNLYNYVQNTVVPEFEKISSVASVDVSGGQKEYVRVELLPEKLSQYHLNMGAVSQAIGSASFSYPAGSTQVGRQELAVSSSVEYNTIDSLKQIPITVGKGTIIYLEDVANIYSTLEDTNGIGRYNNSESGSEMGRDTISLNIKKQQKASAVDVSKMVNRTADQLRAADPDLELIMVNDNSEMITSSLETVMETMIMAIIISMVIIFLFFGDIKASLIVGSSIPVSILTALILMNLMGFSLNVITLSSLVLGVGMMVDNSIVVLESCFRATKGKGFREFRAAAMEGSQIVIQSVIGSTATTCVVFLPLAFLEGMVGQMFKPLGFTIVFCMVASLLSAMTVVPLCYAMYRPKERTGAPASRGIEKLQNGYRSLMKDLLPKKKTVMFFTVALLLISFVMASQLKMELMPANDQGTIDISVEMKPGLTVENANQILEEVEKVVSSDPDYKSYMLTYGNSGMSLGSGSAATLTAYLKSDRSRPTAQVLKEWKAMLTSMADCDITLSEVSSMTMMSTGADSVEVILKSAQYDDLKEASDRIVSQLIERKDVTRVHSTLENSAPVVKVDIDPVKAAAEGLAPVQIASTVNNMISGVEATTLDVKGEEVSVMVEFAPDEYKTIDQLRGIMLTNQAGGSVALSDVAQVVFKDTPASITREDKQYQVTISGDKTEFADENTQSLINKEVVLPSLKEGVTVAVNTMDEMMNEELSSLGGAIAIAVFLIFVVMAAQFESPKFSIMVMTTIPFSLIGAFGLLYMADASISMPSMLGFLMLVGTVVNNGILYIDTVNQYRASMDMQTALIEAGATRLRPILMTTLTTVLSMVPMALAIGENGKLMQGLALVNVGGLLASTTLSLLMLPIYYTIMNRKRKPIPDLD